MIKVILAIILFCGFVSFHDNSATLPESTDEAIIEQTEEPMLSDEEFEKQWEEELDKFSLNPFTKVHKTMRYSFEKVEREEQKRKEQEENKNEQENDGEMNEEQ